MKNLQDLTVQTSRGAVDVQLERLRAGRYEIAQLEIDGVPVRTFDLDLRDLAKIDAAIEEFEVTRLTRDCA